MLVFTVFFVFEKITCCVYGRSRIAKAAEPEPPEPDPELLEPHKNDIAPDH
jgi:hypothetical protein